MRLKKHGGFTLVEISVVVFILLVTILSVAAVVVKNVGSATVSWIITREMALARNVMDSVRSMPWDENAITNPLPINLTTMATTALGPEGEDGPPGSGAAMPFDDLDDWNGYQGAMAGIYNYTVTVEYVSVTDDGVSLRRLIPSTAATDYKRIVVTMTGPSKQQLRLVTIAANARP